MNMFQLEVKELKRIMEVCKKAVSKDMYRPALTQINLRYQDGILTASGTDEYRVNQVFVKEILTDLDFFELNIPVFSITEKVPDVNVFFDDKSVRFVFIGGKSEEYQLVEEDYIKLDRAFPEKDPEYEIAVSAKLLKEMCEAYIKNGESAMFLKFYGELSPIVAKTCNSRQLILPLRR